MDSQKLILGIETSCDETAAAVLKDGKTILSNVISSQIAIHKEYGGIVPELASRHHLEAIAWVVDQALDKAKTSLDDIDAVAVTQGPGLVGSLLVGFSFAKAISRARNIPLAGVNHLHAHLLSSFLGEEVPEFPFIGMVVSGGHTSLYLVKNFFSAELLGHTRDDAAGEAFDKVAKILGLEYPGGPVISRLAEKGRADAFPYPRAMLPDSPFDFSFSGLKTSVLTSVKKINSRNEQLPVEDICASFQEAVVDVLVEKAVRAAEEHRIRNLVISGGVASNQRLREKMRAHGMKKGINVFFPNAEFCTDNGAMVAFAGYQLAQASIFLDDDADVYSRQLF